MSWLETFVEKLSGLLKEPPYLTFLFIGGVFVTISLVSQNYSESIWVFFVYSVAGTVWRYIERDLRKNAIPSTWMVYSIIIYHVVNVVLFFSLLRYLELI